MIVLTSLLFQATLTGQVLADSTRQPIQGVEVIIEKLSRRATTDSGGRFVLTGLPAGEQVVLFRAIGWKPVRVAVRLIEGDIARIAPVMVKDAVTLAPVTVTETPKAPRGVGFEAFEERRKLGFGWFLNSAYLQRRENLRLDDVLQAVPGVTIAEPPVCPPRQTSWRSNCTTYPNKRIAVGRRIVRLSGARCVMQVVLNGVIVGRGGDLDWDDAYDLNLLRVHELKGVEVYRSAGEIPAEFNDTRAACGVVVLWTKP